jgi:hypothetical protein
LDKADNTGIINANNWINLAIKQPPGGYFWSFIAVIIHPRYLEFNYPRITSGRLYVD